MAASNLAEHNAPAAAAAAELRCVACKTPVSGSNLRPEIMYEALGHPRLRSQMATDNPELYGPYAERHGDFGTIIEQCKTHRICKDCCNMIRTPEAGGSPIPPLQMCNARVRYLNQLGKSRGRGNYQKPPYLWSIWDQGEWRSEWTPEQRSNLHGPVIRGSGGSGGSADEKFDAEWITPRWWLFTRQGMGPRVQAPCNEEGGGRPVRGVRGAAQAAHVRRPRA